MGFIPTGPITFTSMLIVFVLVAGLTYQGGRGKVFIAAALLLSWASARATTVAIADGLVGAPYAILIVGLTLSATLACLGRTRASLAIGVFYAVRLVCTAAAWLWGWLIFWELNRVFLYVQFIVALGEILPGDNYRAKVTISVSYLRNRLPKT